MTPRQFAAGGSRLYAVTDETLTLEFPLISYGLMAAAIGGLFAGFAAGMYYTRRRVRRARRAQGRAQETLHRAEVLHAQHLALMDSIDDLAWLKDDQCRFVFVNRKFASVFKRSAASLIGKSDYDLSPPERAAHYQAHDHAVMRTRQIDRVEEAISLAGGDTGWAETVKVPVFDAAGAVIGTAGVARDITERKRFVQQIEQLARHDPLTGLANRLYLQEQFEHFLQRHAHFAVLFLDLDNFKLINDTDGHPVGDELLRVVARRLQAAISNEHVLVRLGGDEFLILMPDATTPARIEECAQRLVTSVCVPYLINGNQYAVSASIGIALFPEHGSTQLQLIKHADIAMYQAKNAGRNRFFWFHEALAVQTAARRDMEMRLRHALEHDGFVLHYQPIIDTASGHIVGAEALIRLLDHDNSLIAPLDFITIAEETGLIEALGDWVLCHGLQQLQQWRCAQLPTVQLSVNISGIQFQNPLFSSRLAQLLEEFAVPGSCLELELTEGVIMSNSASALATLSEIKKLGVALAVDDFGTGYSCLSYLKHLPIDRLKIDRSFVGELPDHIGDVAITRSILLVAAAFKLQVTAEGVEQKNQYDFLRQLGCEAAQGYLFSRPVPADEFVRLLLESQQKRIS